MVPSFPGDRRPPKGTPASPKPTKKSSFLWTLLKAFLTLCIWGICALTLAILWFSYDLPNVQQLQHSNRNPSIVMQSADGTIIGTYGDLHEDTVKLSELPPYVYQAILAIEDRRFHYHFGLDFIGLMRAAYTNYQADRVVQGGSTLTQQLSKNFLQAKGLYKTHDKSLRRKIQEAIMSLWLEWHFTKEQILTIYINRVYLGAGAYGIDAAARKYFNTPARNLNVYQAAVIAGLLKAPSRYSPTNNPKRAYERAAVVLQQMAEEGYIKNPKEYLDQAKKALLEDVLDHQQSSGTKFFTDWIYEQLPNFVPTDQDLVVITTFDPAMQKHAEKVCADHREMGREYKASEIALVSMFSDGAVKAIVGGYDYRQSQFNRAVHALRQPGSTFKLFVYLAGLESGMTPDTMMDDTPVRVGKWAPSSFKWHARGEVSIREAFAHSVNPVTVRIGLVVGPRKIIDVANRLGITSKMTPDLSITLGSMDTTLLQLTSAFATFAHHGLAVWPYGITEIRDKQGNTLYKREVGTPTRVMRTPLFQGMRDLLHACVTIGTGRAAKSAEGGKSGSNGDRDAWFVGYTPKTIKDKTLPSRVVTGVWIGNDNNAPMEKKSVGGRMPARVWEAYSAQLHTLPIQGGTEDVNSLIHAIAEETEELPLSSPSGSFDGSDPIAQEPTAKELEQDNIVEGLIDAIQSGAVAAPTS